jgi:glycosyltransferase involved in cell wall biosynthesis
MASLSVVIPARNEAETIGQTLQDLRARWPWLELIVVDDHSTDATWDVALAHAGITICHNERAPGYGNAITVGLLAATSPRVTIMTADGSDDLETLYWYMFADGVAVADRWTPTHPPVGYPTAKGWLNRLGNGWIAAQVYRRGYGWYDDWTDPFKAYPTALVRSLLLARPLPNDMSAGLALALRAVQTGAPFDVVPTRWVGRRGGRSKFRLREPLAYLRTAWREIG